MSMQLLHTHLPALCCPRCQSPLAPTYADRLLRCTKSAGLEYVSPFFTGRPILQGILRGR